MIYVHGLLPVFQHDEKDLKGFRMFTSQLIAGGTVRQRDIVRAFRVPLASPELFVQLQQQRIAALTYHHYPEGKDWDGGEFREQSVKVANGGTGG